MHFHNSANEEQINIFILSKEQTKCKRLHILFPKEQTKCNQINICTNMRKGISNCLKFAARICLFKLSRVTARRWLRTNQHRSGVSPLREDARAAGRACVLRTATLRSELLTPSLGLLAPHHQVI